MNRFLATLSLAIPLGLLVPTGAAEAHASLAETTAPAGSRYHGIVTIGHGCEESATHTVRIRIPAGVKQTKPKPKPGWKLETVIEKLAEPYTYHGRTITEEVRELVWSGGSLRNDFFDQFEFRAILPETPGKTIYFKTVQECGKGAHRWIEIPEPGKTRRDYKEPAPALDLTD